MLPDPEHGSATSSGGQADWIQHCGGFHVDVRLGWVEELERDASGRAVALLVRKHHVGELMRLPVSAVSKVEPEHGRILVADERLLRPVVRPGLEHRCVRCGYGAASAAAPKRCPMCGGNEWASFDRHERRGG
jgi:rubrerythrin